MKNYKQLAYSFRKSMAAKQKLQFMLAIAVFAIFALTALMGVAFGVIGINEFALIGGGSALVGIKYASVMTASIDGNPSNTQKAGKLVKAKLWILDDNQVDDTVAFPTRTSNREISTIPLKSGEYWHYLKTVEITKPELSIAGSLGEVGATLDTAVKAVLGGFDNSVLDLIEKGAGKGFYIVAEICATGEKWLGGSECSPMILQAPEGGALNAQTSITLNFLSQGPTTWSIYTGTTQSQSAVTIANDATALAVVSGNDNYEIAEGTANTTIATVSGLTDADIGRIITVKGLGGSGPSTIDGSDFMLNGGAAWTANLNSLISFEVYKSGASAYTLVEVPNSRIQT